MFGLARLIDANGLLDSPYDLNVEKAMEGRRIVAPFSGGAEVFHDPVPSLIIQDEAHLLEESLGTFAGLFETTLYQWFRSLGSILGDRMARVPNAPAEIRLPKVVCATATISDPERQIRVLYQKKVRQFPARVPACTGRFTPIRAASRVRLASETACSLDQAPRLRISRPMRPGCARVTLF